MSVEAPKPWTRPAPLPPGWASERLECRYCDPALAPALLEAVDVGRQALTPWLEWAATDNLNVEQCAASLQRFSCGATEPDCTSYVVLLLDRATGDIVGGTGWHNIKPNVANAEFGYWVRGDRHRQGLCTEAMRAHLSWGFTPQCRGGWGFRRIEAYCAAANIASARVLTKLGMRHEVTQREHRWVEGHGWVDTLGFGVLAREWTTPGGA